ncbi:MAG: OsmC family protein [Myxococcota bacterium]
MVRIDVDYTGQLRTRCIHGPSSSELATDAPTDNQGLGEAFSPTDLLATALGSCMLTTMGILARRKGWNMDGAQAVVEKHMEAQPHRRVARLVVAFEMPAGIPEEARVLLERAAHTCPVHKSLHPEVAVEPRFRWPG